MEVKGRQESQRGQGRHGPTDVCLPPQLQACTSVKGGENSARACFTPAGATGNTPWLPWICQDAPHRTPEECCSCSLSTSPILAGVLGSAVVHGSRWPGSRPSCRLCSPEAPGGMNCGSFCVLLALGSLGGRGSYPLDFAPQSLACNPVSSISAQCMRTLPQGPCPSFSHAELTQSVAPRGALGLSSKRSCPGQRKSPLF